MNARTGVLVHSVFMEDGAGLPGLPPGAQPFPSEGFNRVYRVVSGPVRFSGGDVQRIMDDRDPEPIERARSGRAWFPERQFGLFFDAWVAVPLRMGTAMRYSDTYRVAGGADNLEEVLFGFFTNAVATIDSFCFALYAMASMLQPMNFPAATDQERQRINGRSTELAFGKFFGATSIAKLLPHIRGSGEYRQLATIRNVLAHRASPVFYSRADDEAAGTIWMLRGHLGRDLEYSAESMEGHALWLDRAVSEMLVATTDFAETQWEYRRRRATR